MEAIRTIRCAPLISTVGGAETRYDARPGHQDRPPGRSAAWA
jgi:hypothetical protein